MPRVTTCPRLCDARGAPGGRQPGAPAPRTSAWRGWSGPWAWMPCTDNGLNPGLPMPSPSPPISCPDSAGPGPGARRAPRSAARLSAARRLLTLKWTSLKSGEGKRSLSKAWAVQNQCIQPAPGPWRRRGRVSNQDRTHLRTFPALERSRNSGAVKCHGKNISRALFETFSSESCQKPSGLAQSRTSRLGADSPAPPSAGTGWEGKRMKTKSDCRPPLQKLWPRPVVFIMAGEGRGRQGPSPQAVEVAVGWGGEFPARSQAERAFLTA